MSNKRPQGDQRQEEPSWGELIVRVLIAIVLLNLLAVTVFLLMDPTPDRYTGLGIVWALVLVGLALLARWWRAWLARRRLRP